MKTHDFYYDLPEELIAQHPLEDRTASRLMILDGNTGAVEHKHFKELPELLKSGDVLVVNNSRVIPARLLGVRSDTGSAVELLLLKRIDTNHWETLARPGKKVRPGKKFTFIPGVLEAECEEVLEDVLNITELLDLILKVFGKKFLIRQVLCLFHLISMNNLKIKKDIRLYIQKTLVQLLLQLQVFILQRNYCSKFVIWALKLLKLHSTLDLVHSDQ